LNDEVAAAIGGLRAGEPVVLPTDTVYGLCSLPGAEAVGRFYRLKGRDEGKPTALIAPDLDRLLACVPELDERALVVVRALLPGPYTLVLPNAARRFPWLTGPTPDRLGVRVPTLPAAAAAVLAEVGCVAATSANLAGGTDPRRVADVPQSIRAGCAAVVGGGDLPGTPSTVLDLSGPEPRVIREGAVSAPDALERVAAALASG
jgi:L-threonylcarbamoyladenylate synthase